MSQELSVLVPLKMPDSHQADPVLRLKVDVEKLVMEPKLTRTLYILMLFQDENCCYSFAMIYFLFDELHCNPRL